MKILELFCGTKSVGKVFEKNGHEVVSLDFLEKFNPTVCCDILEWDYKKDYKEGDFDVIWASPDCSTWSVASGGKHRLKVNMRPITEKAVIGERLIYKTLEIIDFFKPRIWFIENPRGLLQYFTPMLDLKKTLVYYGNYKNDGELYDMVKATHIWSNNEMWANETKPEMDESTYTIQYHNGDGRYKRFYNRYRKGNPKSRSVIPSELIERIYNLCYNEDV